MANRVNRRDWVITASQNHLHRRSRLIQTKRIHLDGRVVFDVDVQVDASAAPVQIGYQSMVMCGTLLATSTLSIKPGVVQRTPLRMGSYCIVERDCKVMAASIGSYVHIEANVSIGQRVMIGDACRILASSVVADDTVIPSFSIVAGSPGRLQMFGEFDMKKMTSNIIRSSSYRRVATFISNGMGEALSSVLSKSFSI